MAPSPLIRNTVNSTVFDSLDGMRHDIENLDLEYPQIIAIGDQGVGKSTALNRSFGLSILPRSRGLCTLCVIRVRFRRADKFSCTIEARTRNDSQLVEGTRQGVPDRDFNLISAKVQELMETKVSPEKTPVRDKEIVVSVYSPCDPCIDYVDLPGLVSTSGGGGRSERVRDIMDLAREVLEREYEKSIILLVVRAENNCISNSAAAGLIEMLDNGTGSYTSRTVGVLTKVDLFRSEEAYDEEDMSTLLKGQFSHIDQNGKYNYVMPLTTGWIGLGSSLSLGAVDHKTLQSVDAKESEHFETREAFRRFWEHGKLGIINLRSRLVREFEKMLLKNWCPRVETLARESFRECEIKCCNLGMPFCEFPPYSENIQNIIELARECRVPCHSVSMSEPCLKSSLIERAKRVSKFPNIADLCPDLKSTLDEIADLREEVNKEVNGKLSQEELYDKQMKIDKDFADILKRIQVALIDCAKSRICEIWIKRLVGCPGYECPSIVSDLVKSDAIKFMSVMQEASCNDQCSILKLERFGKDGGLLKKWGKFFGKLLQDASDRFKSTSDEVIRDIQEKKSLANFTKLIYNVNDNSFQLKAVTPGEEVVHKLMQLWIGEVTPVLRVSDEKFIDTIQDSMKIENCSKQRVSLFTSMLVALKVIKGIHDLKASLGESDHAITQVEAAPIDQSEAFPADEHEDATVATDEAAPVAETETAPGDQSEKDEAPHIVDIKPHLEQ